MSEPDGTEQPRHLARTRAGKAARKEREAEALRRNLRRRKEQQRDRHERAGKSDLKPA
jgi:hypothetical protein